jgi:hypothetical protein
VFAPTHETAGLPGYPAIDVFGRPGQVVAAGFYGRVRRITGRACSAGGTPGGAYGRSLYIENAPAGLERYITHLDYLLVGVGDAVWPGRCLATLCDSGRSGKPGTTHAHMGLRSAPMVP